MATKLEQLLDSIDPANTLDRTFAQADEAINSFPLETGQITDWQQFQGCLADFLCHIEINVLRLSATPSECQDYYWAHGIQLLRDAYGVNGEKAAFEMARTGKEGGLYAVLRGLALRMAEWYIQNEISVRIGQYWEELTTDEMISAPTEYLAKYGHLLPSELTEGSAVRIRANFPKVLEKHPYLLQQIRRTGR